MGAAELSCGDLRGAVYGLVARELGAADRQRQEQPGVDRILEEIRKGGRGETASGQ